MDFLEKWKQIYSIREKRLCREADEVSTITVQAWMERLPELCQDYKPRNILNLDTLGLLFKTLPERDLIEEKKTKGDKKRMTVTFIVTSDGSFVFEPTFIWRSKRPLCFKSLKDTLRPMSMYYFSNKKTWTKKDMMESILSRPDRKMCLENAAYLLRL